MRAIGASGRRGAREGKAPRQARSRLRCDQTEVGKAMGDFAPDTEERCGDAEAAAGANALKTVKKQNSGPEFRISR
jgi:hypothetical protein